MLKPMLPGRKIKSGLFLLLFIVVGLFAVSLFFPEASLSACTPNATECVLSNVCSSECRACDAQGTAWSCTGSSWCSWCHPTPTPDPNCNCSPEVKVSYPMSSCPQDNLLMCVDTQPVGYYRGFRIENGQCYLMAWLCNGQSLNPGNCNCASTVTADVTADWPTEAACVGATRVFAACFNSGESGETGARYRWENGKCFRDAYNCSAGSLTPTPTGSACPWDIIKTGASNGKVDAADLAELNRCYSPLGGVATGCQTSDLNNNSVINALDYSILLTHWGNCPVAP